MSQTSNGKSLESWIWDAACSIRGAQDAPKYKDYILPLIFTKRLCDVFDDELNRIAAEVGLRAKAFKLVEKRPQARPLLPAASSPRDPEQPVWSVIRKLDRQEIGESLTTSAALTRHRAAVQTRPRGHHRPDGLQRHDPRPARHRRRPPLQPDRSGSARSASGLKDVEADIIGRSYEYLIRKFAEGSGQSAGEFFTPPEVGSVMALIMDPEPGMTVYDPCCGSAGLLIKCEHRAGREDEAAQRKTKYAPLKIYGQEYVADDLGHGEHEHDHPRHGGPDRDRRHLQEPQVPRRQPRCRPSTASSPIRCGTRTGSRKTDYDADELDRFPHGAGFPGGKADWGWVQHILASLNDNGRAGDRPRHRRRLPRLRQREQQQGERRPPVVRRAGPDRRRDLPARKPLLQHHRARHHARS